ncbi:MAG: DUF6036 family nucleotidyltransferase [Candidatus Cyclobacteriaceae bacterium M2_1C_046]
MAIDQYITEGEENLKRLKHLNVFAKSMFEANNDHDQLDIMDITSSDIQDFLKSLNKNKVRYLLVGGVATVFYGHIRTTQDLDLWIEDSPKNKKRLVQALKDVDVKGAEKYQDVPMIPGWSTITIGEKGFVADFMSYMKAFTKEDFSKCYKRSRTGNFEGIPITVIHINDLIKEKMELGRLKDLDDVENLEKIKKQKED